jgi:hypothetical protein
MRTNLFTISFILLQAFMVICILTGAADPQGSSQTVSGFFWFFLTATLIFVMPIRGFSALSSEIKLDTIDLLSLTRLNALRITFGKWAALVAQTLLFVASVLPYIVMRYFFGGVDIFRELLLILGATLLSCLLTAITVGFSSFSSLLIRIAVIGSIFFFLFAGGMGLLVTSTMGGGSIGVSASVEWLDYLAVGVSALFGIAFLLDFGASRIAADSANHSTRKRLSIVAFLLVLGTLAGFGASTPLCAIAGSLMLSLALIDALTEPPTLVPSVYRSFAKNPLSRLAARFLAPGWHTALGFFTLLLVVAAALLQSIDLLDFSLSDKDNLLTFLSQAGVIVLPLPIIHLFIQRVTHTRAFFSAYLLVQICLSAVAVFVTAVADSASGVAGILYVCFPIPHVTLALGLENDADTYFIVAAASFLLLSLFIWYLRARPLLKQSNEIMRLLKEGQPEDTIPTERFLKD